MEAVLSGLIGVLGTLLGSVVTYYFQRQSAERTERIARTERLRQERLAAYSEFAGAATDLRRAAYDRWHRYEEDPQGGEFNAARDEYYRLYAVARNAQLRLRLLTGDRDLVESAHMAVERATEIVKADTEEDRASRGEIARHALDAFVSAAARRLE
ncbi:hypothetical protein [Microbispora sp. NPDC049125]|uniref:hypothetical protein n=1 Tax=Microbispora sp. NPDC049125 TaxID=3154929 RepID=UPI00346593F1